MRNYRLGSGKKIYQTLGIAWIETLSFQSRFVFCFSHALAVHFACGWSVHESSLLDLWSANVIIKAVLIGLLVSCLIDDWWILKVAKDLDLFTSSDLPE